MSTLEEQPLIHQLVQVMAELEIAKEKYEESKKEVRKYYELDEDDDMMPM